jgi:hypothetical protein
VSSPAELDPLRRLVRELVGETTAAPFGAYLLESADPAADIARHVEGEVFLETFENGPEELEAEYGPYEATSLFYVVIDHARRLPAGAMRLLSNPPSGPGLKSWNDLPRFWQAPAVELLREAAVELPAERTWDIATLAIAKDYQSPLGAGLVSLGLYQSVVRSCLALGVEHLVAVLDSLVYRMTRARFAEPFVAYAQARPYLGSRASYPVYCTLAEWEERLRVIDPAVHSIVYEGRGIEHALQPINPEVLSGLSERLSSSPFSSGRQAQTAI